jgi:23S rRNA pseudoU1915 N3-methylase RlmH
MVMADLMTKELRRAIPERRARVMKEYWQKKKQEPLKQLKKNLQAQINTYCNRFNAYRANITTISKTKTPTPEQHAMLRQHTENYAQAKQIRDSLIKQLQEGKDIDPTIKIATLLKPTERSNT